MIYKNLSSALILLAVASCCDELTCCEDNVVTSNYSQAIPAIQLDESDRTVFFATDKYNITKEFAQKIDEKIIPILVANPDMPVAVHGYCDERGTEEYNMKLSQRRANAVKNYLVAKGIPSSRITAEGHGENDPVDPRHNEAAWSKNRRVISIFATQ